MNPIKVLLVDDNNHFIDSIERYLSSIRDPETIIVGKAASGEEAILLVGELNPDLVLMDVTMPGMGGVDATRAIKEGNMFPRVVIVTVHEEEAYRAAAESAGADGFVAKSDLTEKLLPLVRSLFPSCSAGAGCDPRPPAAFGSLSKGQS